MKWRVLAVAALVGCAGPQQKSDWERQHEDRLPPAEEAAPLPPYPRRADLVEFFVAATSAFRFFVDAASLSVGGGVVRYVLVARSAEGVENVSFEGMRCASREVRLYALGRDGAWAVRPGEWRAIEPRGVQRWHNALYREYFCPQRQAIRSREEGVDALRRGGHPLARDFSGDEPRGR